MLDVLDAFFHTVHDYPGGVPAVAQRLDVSPNVLQKKADPLIDTHKPLLIEAMKAQQISRDFRILQAMAYSLGHVAIPLPKEIQLGDMGLLDAYMHTVEGNGALSTNFRQAWANGKIDEAEFLQLKELTYELIGEQLAFLAEIERVVS